MKWAYGVWLLVLSMFKEDAEAEAEADNEDISGTGGCVCVSKVSRRVVGEAWRETMNERKLLRMPKMNGSRQVIIGHTKMGVPQH